MSGEDAEARQTEKQVVTKRGEIELERQYYVCPQCGAGVFPLDKQWQLDGSVRECKM